MDPLLAAAGAGKAAIAVKPEGMSPTTWAVIAIGVPGLIGLLTLLMRLWPQLNQQRNERAASIDDERRHDMDEMRQELREIRRQAEEAKSSAHRMEMRLSCAIPAVSILMAEVRRLDPNSSTNAALKQAQELITAAAAGDLGFSAGILNITDEIARRHTSAGA